MKVTVFVDSLFRDFELDEDQLINKDWNEVVEDMVDSVNKVKEV